MKEKILSSGNFELTFFFHHCICRKKNLFLVYGIADLSLTKTMDYTVYCKTLPRKPIVVTSDFVNTELLNEFCTTFYFAYKVEKI